MIQQNKAVSEARTEAPATVKMDSQEKSSGGLLGQGVVVSVDELRAAVQGFETHVQHEPDSLQVICSAIGFAWRGGIPEGEVLSRADCVLIASSIRHGWNSNPEKFREVVIGLLSTLKAESSRQALGAFRCLRLACERNLIPSMGVDSGE